MADFDCLLQTMCLLTGAFLKHYEKAPYIVIAAKHGNPCGLAVDWDSPGIALENALSGNSIAIFGGEVMANFAITEELARILVFDSKRKSLSKDSKRVLDLIIAPDFSEDAVKILGSRSRSKLFKNENLVNPRPSSLKWAYRMVRGGFLRQPPPNYILELALRSSLPDSNSLDSLIIAWATVWTSMHGGNEVAIAKDRMLVGAGGGPATIDACRTAINRAKECGHSLKKSVFAADAFFPFTDAPAELSKAGCIYGIVPGGGRKFEEIKAFFKKHSLKVFYLPEQFRGFCRH
jgi:phosphoribosylaminoimidazolecarboxamide formyltransferase/IMP cyclohydrolase